MWGLAARGAVGPLSNGRGLPRKRVSNGRPHLPGWHCVAGPGDSLLVHKTWQAEGIGVTSKIRLHTVVVASVLGILSTPTPWGNQLPCHQTALWRGPHGKELMSLANSRQGLRPPTAT